MRRIAFLLIVTLFLTSCLPFKQKKVNKVNPETSFEKISFDDTNPNVSEAVKESMKYSNQMGLDIFEVIYNNEKNINLLISPISMAYALGMLQNGATGDTKDQILEILNSPDDSNNSAYNEIMNFYKSVSGSNENGEVKAIIELANSFWVKEELTPIQSFVNILKSEYDAQIFQSDFTSDKTIDTMNDWVEKETNGLLEDTVNSFNPLTVAVIINTIYFKSNWKNRFNESLTTKRPFYLKDGDKKDVDMMQNSDFFPYMTTESGQMLSLDYYDGFRMILYLPKNNLDDFFEDYKVQSILQSSGNDGFTRQKVDFYLPKFDFKVENKLKDTLTAMGMVLPFDKNKANFSSMFDISDGNVFINDIIQNARITVDEEGTEAAAVTAIEMATTSAMSNENEPIEFKCDHPFMFMIQDTTTGANLFLGIVNNPLEN